MFSRARVRLVFLFAVLLSLNAWCAGAFYNVVDYGAHRDGSAPSTVRRPRRTEEYVLEGNSLASAVKAAAEEAGAGSAGK